MRLMNKFISPALLVLLGVGLSLLLTACNLPTGTPNAAATMKAVLYGPNHQHQGSRHDALLAGRHGVPVAIHHFADSAAIYASPNADTCPNPFTAAAIRHLVAANTGHILRFGSLREGYQRARWDNFRAWYTVHQNLAFAKHRNLLLDIRLLAGFLQRQPDERPNLDRPARQRQPREICRYFG